ncbi:hypothetical protein [Lutibacter sp. B1]|uniref:hypothetical protein n=1 Tax=Lutibacter sp. B1 TaxID=2725996 RepID=UPI001456AF20|nr:hypothetical protein [Lutibacter sp. B1]NLP59490.1 hypothetical protein [Lutibacter sp. B1]
MSKTFCNNGYIALWRIFFSENPRIFTNIIAMAEKSCRFSHNEAIYKPVGLHTEKNFSFKL